MVKANVKIISQKSEHMWQDHFLFCLSRYWNQT